MCYGYVEHTSFLLHGLLNRGQAALELRIVGVVLETGLVGIVCAEQVSLAVEGGGFAAPALAPVRLELGGLLGVLEGVVPVLLGGVGGGSVGVEDVVVGLQGDGLGELVTDGGGRERECVSFCGFVLLALLEGVFEDWTGLHGVVKVLFGNGLVAQSFELVCGSHIGKPSAGTF